MENKTLIERLGRSLKRPRKDINNLVEALSQVLQEHLSELDTVAIPGFGNFEGVKHEEHITTDTASGKRFLNPPCVAVEFTVSNVLKNKIKLSHEK